MGLGSSQLAMAVRVAGSALILLALTPPVLVGQWRPSLREVLTVALRDNPDVRAAWQAVDSAQAERRIVRALPNPALSAVPNNPYQYTIGLPLTLK